MHPEYESERERKRREEEFLIFSQSRLDLCLTSGREEGGRTIWKGFLSSPRQMEWPDLLALFHLNPKGEKD